MSLSDILPSGNQPFCLCNSSLHNQEANSLQPGSWLSVSFAYHQIAHKRVLPPVYSKPTIDGKNGKDHGLAKTLQFILQMIYCHSAA